MKLIHTGPVTDARLYAFIPNGDPKLPFSRKLGSANSIFPLLSTRIFSNPEMHAHAFLLFLALLPFLPITSQGLGPFTYLQHLRQHLRSTVEGVWGFFRNEVSQAKILIPLRNLHF